MDSVGLSRLKEIEKDRLKAEEQQVTTETVTATIKQRKRVSFTILGHNNKDNGSSSSIRRVKGFSRKCKKCNGVLMKEELRNNLNSNHEPIEQRGAKRPSNDLPHTCSRGSKNKHGKCDNDIDMERKKPVPMKELIGIMRVPPRFSSSTTSSSSSLNNNNNNNNNDNIGAPQHAQHAQQQQPIVRFKYSKLVNALKRSNETRGLIEKIVKKIKTDFNSSSLMSSSSSSPASASASAPNNCTNNNDSEEESRRRCSVRRKVCAEFTKAMMAQTLPSTMISYVENNVMIFNSNNSNSKSNSNSNSNNHNNANVMMPSMMMMMNRRRRCATMGNGGRTRIVHRILIDQHKRILGDNNNERKDNTTTTKNPPTTGKKKMKEDDK